MTKGILLCAWGARGYGFASYNMALTVKHYSPNIPIHFLATESVLKYTPISVFDDVEVISEPVDPGRFKVSLYEKFPFDHTLFLDVDGIALQDINPLFDRLMKDERPYRCHVYDYYDKSSPNEMPLMYWADRDVIWNHYDLDDHILPATQSSLQYIRKGEFTEKLFRQVEQNFDDPIPLEMLRNKWGGTQPDELYLNIALAQLGCKPDLNDVIYFGNDDKYKYHEIKQKFYFFSYFGGRGMIKNLYLRAIDKETSKMGSKFKMCDIIPYKHANKKTKSLQQMPVSSKKDGEIILLTSLYDASPVREAELMKCLQHNIRNPLIKKIVLLGEKGFDHPKVQWIEAPRPTYRDFFDVANKMGDEYFILANSDIYFDNSLASLYGINFHKLLLAISRHDVKKTGGQILFDATGWGRKGWSQDAWIWKGKMEVKGGDYHLGLPGCDNKIAYEADESGYRLHNPARDIKIFHLHESNERNYSEGDRLPEPYKNVMIRSIKEITKKKLLLIQPGKVGDILICLPIAKYYSKQFRVDWMCPREYHNLFEYVDYVRPVTNQVSKYDRVIDLSFGLNTNSPVHKWWINNRNRFDSFVTAKYELADVPVEERWNLDYKRDTKKEGELYNRVIKSTPYKLVHKWSAYGTPVEMEGVEFKPVGDFTVFDWRKVIEMASEIHCIDSSLCNFVEVIPTNAELFYYKTDRVPQKYDETLLIKPWNRIEHQYKMTSLQEQ